MKLEKLNNVIQELTTEWNVTLDVHEPEAPGKKPQLIATVFFDDCPLIDYSVFCKCVYEIAVSKSYDDFYIKQMSANHQNESFSIVWEEK